jgi:glutathione S-transferase
MQLIGLFDSPYVRRVAVSLHLHGMEFEHVALSVFRDQDEMRAINPLFKVPMLVLDSGEKLIESSFILDYLDAEVTTEKRLVPAAGPARRQILQQCAIALLGSEKAVQVVYDTQLRPAQFSYEPWVARCTAQMHTAFAMLEAMPLSGVPSATALTQGDVTAAVVYRFARYRLPSEFPDGRYPQLEKLSAYCEALPAFARTPLE